MVPGDTRAVSCDLPGIWKNAERPSSEHSPRRNAIAEARGGALRTPARTRGKGQGRVSCGPDELVDGERLCLTHRRAVRRRGQLRAIGVNPGAPDVEEDLGLGVMAL